MDEIDEAVRESAPRTSTHDVAVRREVAQLVGRTRERVGRRRTARRVVVSGVAGVALCGAGAAAASTWIFDEITIEAQYEQEFVADGKQCVLVARFDGVGVTGDAGEQVQDILRGLTAADLDVPAATAWNATHDAAWEERTPQEQQSATRATAVQLAVVEQAQARGLELADGGALTIEEDCAGDAKPGDGQP